VTRRIGGSNEVTVPKATIVSNLVRVLHEGALFVHGDLPEWPALRRELQNFRPEVTRSGRETWNAAAGSHDDLLISASLCAWHMQGAQRPSWGFFELMRQRFEGEGETFIVGADIGQSRDPTAICVMSKVDRPTQADITDSPYAPAGAWHYRPPVEAPRTSSTTPVTDPAELRRLEIGNRDTPDHPEGPGRPR
jgi:hypothetical protein